MWYSTFQSQLGKVQYQQSTVHFQYCTVQCSTADSMTFTDWADYYTDCGLATVTMIQCYSVTMTVLGCGKLSVAV